MAAGSYFNTINNNNKGNNRTRNNNNSKASAKCGKHLTDAWNVTLRLIERIRAAFACGRTSGIPNESYLKDRLNHSLPCEAFAQALDLQLADRQKPRLPLFIMRGIALACDRGDRRHLVQSCWTLYHALNQELLVELLEIGTELELERFALVAGRAAREHAFEKFRKRFEGVRYFSLSPWIVFTWPYKRSMLPRLQSIPARTMEGDRLFPNLKSANLRFQYTEAREDLFSASSERDTFFGITERGERCFLVTVRDVYLNLDGDSGRKILALPLNYLGLSHIERLKVASAHEAPKIFRQVVNLLRYQSDLANLTVDLRCYLAGMEPRGGSFSAFPSGSAPGAYETWRCMIEASFVLKVLFDHRLGSLGLHGLKTLRLRLRKSQQALIPMIIDWLGQERLAEQLSHRKIDVSWRIDTVGELAFLSSPVQGKVRTLQ